MGKINEFVTYWGPSGADWGDGTEKRFMVERDEALLKQGASSGGRKMKKINIDDILSDDVVTGIDMVNGYMPLVLYGNEDMIIEVANCDAEQGGWHRNMGADEWAFQNPQNQNLASSANIRIYRDLAPTVPMAATAVTSVGGSQKHTNMAPFQCINYIIALTGIFPSRN